MLARFVDAAQAGDAGQMWALLSTRSRHRYGPLARFRSGEAYRLQRKLSALRRPELLLGERLTAIWAVEAISGDGPPYAAALRLDHGSWKVELGDPLRIRPLRPNPGERVVDATQLAAEVRARSPIEQAGLWLDGSAVGGRAGGPRPETQSMYTPRQTIEPGIHVVVGFASAGPSAAAHAWRFRVVPDLRD